MALDPLTPGAPKKFFAPPWEAVFHTLSHPSVNTAAKKKRKFPPPLPNPKK